MNTSSQSSHPFSSISLSPAGTYAVASSRDVLHIARGSNIFRSVRIAQHFQTNTSTVNRGQSSIHNSQYTHMHDALRISGASTTPAPTAGGGGGVNVNVTDVAWSLPQSFVLDNGSVGSGTSGAGKGVTDCSGLEDCSPTFSSMDALDSEQNSYHHPPFISRVHVKLKEQQTSNKKMPAKYAQQVERDIKKQTVKNAKNFAFLSPPKALPPKSQSGFRGKEPIQSDKSMPNLFRAGHLPQNRRLCDFGGGWVGVLVFTTPTSGKF